MKLGLFWWVGGNWKQDINSAAPDEPSIVTLAGISSVYYAFPFHSMPYFTISLILILLEFIKFIVYGVVLFIGKVERIDELVFKYVFPCISFRVKMKPKVKKLNVSSRKRASAIKHANKKYSKMQKQGKLRSKTNKKKPNLKKNDANELPPSKVLENKEEAVLDHDIEENDILDMIEEEDLQFLNASKHNYSFLNYSLAKEQGEAKRSNDEEMECEKYPRSYGIAPKETRPLLPLKNKRGLIHQSEEIESSNESGKCSLWLLTVLKT